MGCHILLFLCVKESPPKSVFQIRYMQHPYTKKKNRGTYEMIWCIFHYETIGEKVEKSSAIVFKDENIQPQSIIIIKHYVMI